jgi:thiol:disulfide interchange protein
MAREVYTDKKYIEFSRKFVFLRFFADTDPEGERLEKRYEVNGVPTLLILDSRGKEVDRIVGARTADELIEELELIFEYASEESHPIRI